MTAEDIGRLIGWGFVFIAAACICTRLGFMLAADRRARLECLKDGHQWDTIGIGLQCKHCGKLHKY